MNRYWQNAIKKDIEEIATYLKSFAEYPSEHRKAADKAVEHIQEILSANEDVFQVTSLDREDLDTHFVQEGLGERFTNTEMLDLADKIEDRLLADGEFWDALEYYVRDMHPEYLEE